MGACCDTSTTSLKAEFDAAPSLEKPQKWVRFAVAIVLAGLSMQFSLGVNLSPVAGYTRLWTHGGLALASGLVFALLGGPIIRRSWTAVRNGRVTLEQLFLLGIAGAFGASLFSSFTGTGAIYYEVVGVLAAVYTFGQILVERQRSKVSTSLHRLTDSLRTAVRLTCCGKRRVVPVSELEPGDRVFVEKGQRLPVDGTIAEGSAYVQEIAHTGEPFPVARTIGDSVLAGTVALDGNLVIAASGASGSRELDQLAQRLEAALSQRSEWQREADRWMTWFVPGVIAIAAGTIAFWLWRTGWQQALFNSLAVLLVACPCGLGLGVPIALWHAMHRLTHLGIVPAGSELIERLARVRTVIFDKTGTLTEEEIRLEALITLIRVDSTALRARLALIENHCNHPVARPFSALSDTRPDSRERLLSIETMPGQGIAARLSQKAGNVTEVRIGNRSLLQTEHGAALEELRSRIPEDVGPGRELFIIEDGHLSALASLTEKLRPAVTSLAPRLRKLDLELGIMTGDASPNERRWTEAGLRVSSGMTTAAKAAAVRSIEARNEHVLFVGDGLNDTEAMAAATASLVMHGGDATAGVHAHGEISGGSLSTLPEAIALSRAARRQIRLILGISIIYNAAGLLLAATGWLHPVVAAVIMFASSMTVVALAGRLESTTARSKREKR
jgi:Cu+-exporting ATPase